MASTPVQGLRTTQSYATGQIPQYWRETLMRLYPQGKTPITGLTLKMKKWNTTSYRYNHFRKDFPDQMASIVGVYTNANCASGYTSGTATSGTSLYVKVTIAEAKHFREGHIVRFIDDGKVITVSGTQVFVVGRVASVNTFDGTYSVVCVTLREADSSMIANGASVVADKIHIVGNSNEEGSYAPIAVNYNATPYYNVTQNFRTTAKMSRSMKKEKARAMKDPWKEEKKEKLELHGIEMENAWLYGIRDDISTTNGEPDYTTGGIIWWMQQLAPANIGNYVGDGTDAYAGQTFATKGWEWLNDYFVKKGEYGWDNPIAFCGSYTIKAIQDMARTVGDLNIANNETMLGIKVTRLITPWGDLGLYQHPLMTRTDWDRRAMVVIEPADISYVYKDDTFWEDATPAGFDGEQGVYTTEAGIDINFPEKCLYLTGFGLTNTQSAP